MKVADPGPIMLSRPAARLPSSEPVIADREVAALQAVAVALEGLDENARERILRWAMERYAPDLLDI